MRYLPILCGILSGCCLIGVHDWKELRTSQEEERQAIELRLELNRTLNERQWFSWKPPFGRRGLYKSVSQSGNRIWGVRHNETEMADGSITNVPEDEIEWGFGKGAWGTKGFIRVDKHSKVILSDESIERIVNDMEMKAYFMYKKISDIRPPTVDGCSSMMESRLRVAVTKHPVWDGMIDVMYTDPPYSDEYEAGFDAAFNIALVVIQAYKWSR